MAEPAVVLTSDQAEVDRLLLVLGRLAEELETHHPVALDDLRSALAIVAWLLGRCHHLKVETVILPALHRASPVRGAEVAQRLSKDHRGLQLLVGAVQQVVSEGRAEGPGRSLLARYLDKLAGAVRTHLRAEDEILRPWLKAGILSEEERTRISQGFERLEESDLGPGVHDRYREAIQRLYRVYVL
jgi:hemerythrin-like domain-containing protein